MRLLKAILPPWGDDLNLESGCGDVAQGRALTSMDKALTSLPSTRKQDRPTQNTAGHSEKIG